MFPLLTSSVGSPGDFPFHHLGQSDPFKWMARPCIPQLLFIPYLGRAKAFTVPVHPCSSSRPLPEEFFYSGCSFPSLPSSISPALPFPENPVYNSDHSCPRISVLHYPAFLSFIVHISFPDFFQAFLCPTFSSGISKLSLWTKSTALFCFVMT